MSGCNFIIAWRGRCGENDCHHASMKCHCGKQAVQDCPMTMGAMICGTYVCREHAPHNSSNKHLTLAR